MGKTSRRHKAEGGHRKTAPLRGLIRHSYILPSRIQATNAKVEREAEEARRQQ